MKTLLLIALLPVAATAQLTATLNGATFISGNAYSLGTVPVGSTSTALLSISNSGSTCVSVQVTVSQFSGFTVDRSTGVIVPNSLQANALNVTITFSPNSSPIPQASYSGSIEISPIPGATCSMPPPISAFLQGYGVYVPTLSVLSGCAGVSPVNFGSIQIMTTGTCNLTLTNSNPVPITISTPVLTGAGFTGLTGLAAQTISPSQIIPFSINFAPPGQGAFSGTLALAISPSILPSPYTLSFALSGAGLPPPFPTPSLTFDPGTFLSGQQRVLTMTLPSPAPFAASGYVNLSFTPMTPVVADDSMIFFLAGSVRTLPFSVSAGATTVLINGQSSATFQTGTTEGTITFTVTSPQIPSNPPTVSRTIQGAPVMIDSTTSASKERTGFLDITIIGADNTYSTSKVSFSFFDTSGNPIQSANADFSSTFKSYYANVKNGGSMFQALVSFPVTGSVATIGSVTVTLTNAAGTASTGSLTFQ
jgi:hypothetical protein